MNDSEVLLSQGDWTRTKSVRPFCVMPSYYCLIPIPIFQLNFKFRTRAKWSKYIPNEMILSRMAMMWTTNKSYITSKRVLNVGQHCFKNSVARTSQLTKTYNIYAFLRPNINFILLFYIQVIQVYTIYAVIYIYNLYIYNIVNKYI